MQMPVLQDCGASKSLKFPTNVKSRSGYLICLGGCHIIWRSKLQTLIALSTMEAKYIMFRG